MLNEIALVILATLLVMSVAGNVAQYQQLQKARRSLVKAATGFKKIGAIQERDQAQLEAVIEAVSPIVLKMDSIDIPNAKKRTAAAATFLQNHPGMSYRLVTQAIDEACRRRKA